MFPLHPITIALIVANLIVSLRGFNHPVFFQRYKFSVLAIRAGQRDRMVTSGFLHVDVAHLLFNMITLYFFAGVAIKGLGGVSFAILYMISLLSGSLLSLYFHKKEPHYNAVGASGAVTGVLYSAIILQPNMQLGIMFIPIPLPAYVVGIAYLLYSIYGMKRSLGNVGHAAHFGGAIGGYLTTLWCRPDLLVTDTLITVLLAVPIVVLFVLEKMKKQ